MRTLDQRTTDAGRLVLPLLLLLLLNGCFLRPVEREYLSNDELLQTIARNSSHEVDPGSFQLIAVDVHNDAVTFQYQGVEYPGDRAWVIRFSEKSTEQNPDALREVHPFLKVLEEEHRNFNIVFEGPAELDGYDARYVSYEFSSPVHDGAGKPLQGRGILASLGPLESDASGWVYQVKLDNYGDRVDLGWGDLQPLLAPLLGGGTPGERAADSAPSVEAASARAPTR